MSVPIQQKKHLKDILFMSSCFNKAEDVDALIAQQAIPLNADDAREALWRAVKLEYVKTVKMLLTEYLADMNFIDPIEGCTPLHYAIKRRNHGLVNLLLTDPRTNVILKDFNKETPLFLACSIGYTYGIQRLLQEPNPGVNHMNEYEETPLHQLVKFHHQTDQVQLLVDHLSFTPALKSLYGRTALHIAWKAGNYSYIEILMKAGFSACDRDDAGQSVLQESKILPDTRSMYKFIHTVEVLSLVLRSWTKLGNTSTLKILPKDMFIEKFVRILYGFDVFS